MPATRSKDLVAQADGLVGRGIEWLTVSHHRRRLSRVGWASALDPAAEPWAAGEPRPRAGNSVRVMVDGGQALAAMATEIRAARSHIHVTGWHLNPAFALTNEDPPPVLRALLAEAAKGVRVRVLLWAGAPIPLFRPSRKDMRRVQRDLSQGNGIECALDARERPMHCHHDKTIVIDDRVAFVGGIDLTDLGGDRLDLPDHPTRDGIGWHDAAVRIEGPAVEDVANHFRQRWQATTAQELAAPEAQRPAGDIEIQVVRTIPDGMYRAMPRGEFRILEAYVAALRSASKFIYLENQFLWSPEILAILRMKLRNPPSDSFRLVVLLPARANNGADDTRGQLGTLIQADAGGQRLLACTLVAPGGQTGRPVYVHAKIGIVDDRWLTVGSANLNEHSLFNDTEVNVVARDEGLVRDTRERLWAEHLDVPRSAVAGDPTEVVDTLWRPTVQQQADRRARGEAPSHRLTTLPGLSKRSGLILGPLQGLTVDA